MPVAAVEVACFPFVAFVDPKEAVASFGVPVLVDGLCYQNSRTVGADHFVIAD